MQQGKKYFHVNIHGFSSSSLGSKHIVKIAEEGGRSGEFPPRPARLLPRLEKKLLAEEAETWVGRTRVVSNLEEGEQAGPSGAAREAWDSGDDLGGF